MKRIKEYTWVVAVVGITALLLFQLLLAGRLYEFDKNRFQEKVEEVIKQAIPQLNINLGLSRNGEKNFISFDLKRNKLTIVTPEKRCEYNFSEGKSEKEIFERVYYDASEIRWSASMLDTLVQHMMEDSYHSTPLKIIIRDSLGNVIDTAGSLQKVPAGVFHFAALPLGYVTGRTLEAYYYFPFFNFLCHESDRMLMTATLFILLVLSICFLIRTIRVERKMAVAREEFMHIVVHNLKSPVNFVLRMSYEIRNRAAQPYTDEQEKLYEELKTKLNTMGEGIQRLLTNSVGVYGLHLEKCKLDLKQEIKKIVVQYERLSGKTIGMKCDLPECCLWADPVHLSGAVANLVENAVKYTGTEGKIDVICTTDTQYVRIAVKDNGPGIPAREMSRIFKKYYRVNSKGQKGFGLGLNYVKKVVLAHGGSVEVSCKDGCEFTIILPWIR